MARKIQFRVWHAATFMVGMSALSYVSTRKGPRAYWQALNKTPSTPPAWVFPAVWSGLSVLQLWADLRVLNNSDLPDRNTILGLRAVNWLLYAVFTPTLFRAKSPVSAEILTLAEGVTAGATIAILAGRDPVSAAALAPLTLWTGYAALVAGGTGAKNTDNIVDRLRWDGAF
jgi:tryptophan-rich sensory protein